VICDRWVLGGVVGVVGYCIVSMLDDTVIRLSIWHNSAGRYRFLSLRDEKREGNRRQIYL